MVTYRGLSHKFGHVELGGLWEIPENYNDPVRCRVISSLVRALLGSYDCVVRCDIDEILVPDPRQSPDLAAYIETLDRPYMTGRGLEVMEGYDEPPLNSRIPILVQQRRFCFRASSLNKTCITSVPLEWGPGFHGCTVFPMLRDLYLFHIKHADVSGRLQWFADLKASAPGTDTERYCDTGIANIQDLRRAVLGRERLTGWDNFADRSFDQNYLDTVKYDAAKIYLGSFSHQDKLLEIPSEFLGMF
ncbi:MAG TPA: hypothetical protein VG651_24910 [Stellaceae bacterium]|nr:hypothetical protein [Stellaceae bacterium]